GRHCEAGGCESTISVVGEARMDVHQNARTTPHSREKIVSRVLVGESARAVAEDVGVCESTVRKWLRRYHHEGRAGLHDRLCRPLAWFRRHGIRVCRLMTDNAFVYRGHAVAALCQRQRLRHLWTRPYTPRTNGKAERFIQTLLREWAYRRPYATSALRTRAL